VKGSEVAASLGFALTPSRAGADLSSGAGLATHSTTNKSSSCLSGFGSRTARVRMLIALPLARHATLCVYVSYH
jgi:hypothetical protein